MNPGCSPADYEAEHTSFTSAHPGYVAASHLDSFRVAEYTRLDTMRVSFGIASNFSDAYRFMRFVTESRDRPASVLG